MATINTNAAANTTFAAAVCAFNQAVRAWKGRFFVEYGKDYDDVAGCDSIDAYTFNNAGVLAAARALSEFGRGEYGCYKMYSRGLIYSHPYDIRHILKDRCLFATITTYKSTTWVNLAHGAQIDIEFLDGVEARRKANDEYKAARKECLALLIRGHVLSYTSGQEGGYVEFQDKYISARGLAVKADELGYEIKVGGGLARATLDADEDYGFKRPVKVRRQFAYNPQRVNAKLKLRALDHARRESEIDSLLR